MAAGDGRARIDKHIELDMGVDLRGIGVDRAETAVIRPPYLDIGNVMTDNKTTHEIYITLRGIQQGLAELRTDLKALTTTVVGGLDGEASMLMRLALLERRMAQIDAKQVEDEKLRQEFAALKNRVLGAAAVLSFLSMGVGGVVVRLVG